MSDKDKTGQGSSTGTSGEVKSGSNLPTFQAPPPPPKPEKK